MRGIAETVGPIKTRRVSEGEAKRPLKLSPTYLAQVCSAMANFSALPLADASGLDKCATSKVAPVLASDYSACQASLKKPAAATLPGIW